MVNTIMQKWIGNINFDLKYWIHDNLFIISKFDLSGSPYVFAKGQEIAKFTDEKEAKEFFKNLN